ncbi:hypothetical protein [Bacillus gaemokensis]|uniref:Uncharacterized protein n=1 Tax=Bacillus gaemokensis TaxID=574375 RepID=A0A073KA04_9BACI|nr:hypothetical protein [Bacillus gaemokensis]KEK23356.1 hypothetical protein BAGA_09565 [Bacillus gaemokensis]KYG37859.1 hypothetical protein AZF08_21345 [Bacillus gaemokensis]
MPEPIVQFETNGKASILNYNVPEPTSYTGKNCINIELDGDIFIPGPNITEPPARDNVLEDGDEIQQAVSNALQSGYFPSKYFPNVKIATNSLAIHATEYSPETLSKTASTSLVSIGDKLQLRNILAKIDPPVVSTRIKNGERLNIYKNMYGTYEYNFITPPKQADPRLMLVEIYRLTSFAGDYGAGRTIKTFSLLPGERTKMTIKTYRKTETEEKRASSILDSFTEESAKSFEDAVQSEQSDKRNSSENFEYHVEAEANAAWGWGSAKVSGGVKGGSNSSREEFTKNVSNATQKHSSKASAKRDVQINTSYESKVTTGEETTIERQLENINVSRTLNFVFRQMNQEFITLLHLVDVRVAFFNGFAESRREYPLTQLDDLLEEVVKETERKKVRQIIIDELTNIFDYQDNLHSIIEQKNYPESEKHYYRVKKDLKSTYKGKTVSGIILSAKENVMRTDGVIVEALLGQGDALDAYSHGLQDETVREKKLTNELAQAKLLREQLAQKIVNTKDTEAAKLYEKIFPCCKKDGDEQS